MVAAFRVLVSMEEQRILVPRNSGAHWVLMGFSLDSWSTEWGGN